MGCGCNSGISQTKVYNNTTKAAVEDINCTYTIKELQEFLEEERLKDNTNSMLMSYLRSQINTYKYNCNLFVTKIDELRGNSN